MATSPSNAHAYRLYVVNDPLQEPPALRRAFSCPTPLRSAKPSIMTEFLEDCQPLRSLLSCKHCFRSVSHVSEDSHCSTLWAFSSMLASQPGRWHALMKTPRRCRRGASICSLTMSYFHTGIRTIIGAEAFHCPVRDGKEWDHLAMVIRLNWLPCSLVGCKANS